MTEQKEALKPCPFCGGGNVHPRHNPSYLGRYVECDTCEARGPVMYAKVAAISCWNTRADEAELATLRAKLAERDEAITSALSVLEDAPEINPSNYEPDVAIELNSAANRVWEILEDALTGGDND